MRQLTGRDRHQAVVDGVDAHSLNAHYTSISTDHQYTPPLHKLSATHSVEFESLSEWRVFHVLVTLHSTSTGLDQLPAWFLRLGAPLFYQPLTQLFNLSLATSFVPHQWKQVYICPVNKIPAPKTHSDFRPISITPVITRIIERIVVRDYIYQALLNPPSLLSFRRLAGRGRYQPSVSCALGPPFQNLLWSRSPFRYLELQNWCSLNLV